MPAAVRRPVLNTQQEFVPTVYPFQKVQGGMGAPIPTQFSGGVATSNSPIKNVLDEPVKQKDTSNLVPVVVNGGTSMAYTVMLDPENNSVHSDGSDISNMMLNNVDAEKIALEAANQQYRQNTVVDPYQEAEKDMGVATDKFNLAVQKELPAGGYLEEFTDAQDEATAILDQDVKPNVIDGVLNKTNTYRQAPHALEALEAQNPYEQLENKTFSEVEAILNAPTEDKPILKNNQYDPVNDMVSGENLFAYNDPDPVLTDRGKPKANAKGVLDTTSSNDRKGSVVSANARGSAMPYGKVGRNEMLMRMGAKMMAGSTQGYGAAMDAAFSEYGNIQDANRKAETDAFNKAEATRLAEERIAALRAKADAKNVKTPNTAAMQYGMAALNAIDRIEALVNAEQKWVPWDNTTGLIGNLMKSVPASAANDVLANIKTIEAAVGFDRLQAMRDASPTGGALGQVSNIELDLLKSSLGNLNQSQSKEQFMMNLKQVQRVYNEIVHTDIHSPNRKTTVETDTNNDLSDDEKKYLGL